MTNEKKFEDITWMDCTKYEAVRNSGVTNMFDIKVVERISGLDRQTIVSIMDNYTKLNKKFNFRIEE